jgi:hypothetical protein
LDTKERRTPVRRPIPARPELASGTAHCGKTEIVKTSMVSRARRKFFSHCGQAPQLIFRLVGGNYRSSLKVFQL